MSDQNQLRDSIESLINSNVSSPVKPEDLAHQSNELPSYLKIEPLEYDREQIKAKNKARKTINSLLKFYLDEDVISSNEYIIAKAQVSEMQLSTLFFQIKTSEHAIITLHKKIHSGDSGPRMFEVLANLQSTLLEMMKLQTIQMIANEESMKRLKHDLNTGAKAISHSTDSASAGAPIRGTRGLMKEIQGEIEDADFTEVPEDEDPFEEKKDSE